ncbi:sensor histidine kinase [Sphaerisporangium perillae]|uniref:sensor histidine kinase n=1 Tax=Sphaerisporangium perillae TaxID=2935860 RepID=UPI0020106B03|nr:sensor histidine kinase [Sphaerisporangium perillae]
MSSRAWASLVRPVRPLVSALVTGTAEPATPRSPRLRLRLPLALRPLPFATVDLVVVGDFVLAYILYASGISVMQGAATLPEPGSHGPIMYLLAAGFSVPLALRDRWPVAAWRITAATVILGAANLDVLGVEASVPAGEVLPYNAGETICYLLCAYSVAVRAGGEVTLGVWIVSVVGSWIIHPNSMFLASTMVTVALLFGYNVRARRRATNRLAEERQRGEEQRAARSVLEERARIARELHDIVAHHMSVIAIQAEAVPLRATGDPVRLEAGLAEIRVLSLAALAEMRQVLGALRGEDGRRETAPQPGLGRLDDLTGNARSGGLAVTVDVTGSLELPPAVGLSAYRILQESLSNAMRHAPGSSVRIEIVRTTTELRLQVTSGPGRRPASPGTGPDLTGRPPRDRQERTPPPSGGGQGIIGMRERAILLGGTLEAAPTPGGGFAVTATLPIVEDE